MFAKRMLCSADEVSLEAGQRIDPPLRKVTVRAIIDKPFAGRVERDLKPLTDGIMTTLPDGPVPNEIAVICTFASRGRPNHRVGWRRVRSGR